VVAPIPVNHTYNKLVGSLRVARGNERGPPAAAISRAGEILHRFI